MSVLTGPEIEWRQRPEGRSTNKWLSVEPWRPECVGPNSVDVHLGDELVTYCLGGREPHWIDPIAPPPTEKCLFDHGLGRDAWYLVPGRVYLGCTVETVELTGFCAWVDGRSSFGRLGVSCHVTAGMIDDGFRGRITLEITVVHPTILWPGIRLAQLSFSPVVGQRRPYKGRYQDDAGPVASRFHVDKEIES
jgi:dCTP deaminase